MYNLQLISPDGVTVTIHLRLVLTSLEKVEREEEVDWEDAADGRLDRYHVSVGVADEVAFLNLEAPNFAGAILSV